MLIIMIVSERMGIIQEVNRVDLEIEDTHSRMKLSIAFISVSFFIKSYVY